MTVTLATIVVEFLERPGLAASTRKTYEFALRSLLQEYGSWSIEILGKQTLIEYLNSEWSFKVHDPSQASSNTTKLT